MHRLIICILLSFFGARSMFAAEKYLSPLDLKADSSGKHLYIAQHTAKSIAVMRVADRKVVKTISLPGKPNGLAISPDDKQLYVTCGGYNGLLCVVDLKKGKAREKIRVGHTPMSPVLSKDGKQVYVCNRFDNSVVVVNLRANKVVSEIMVTREPVAAVLAPDGKWLFVANHLSIGAANVDEMGNVVDVIDTATGRKSEPIELLSSAVNLRGITVSHDGKYVYVTSNAAHYLVPATQIERSWINGHAMHIIGVKEKKRLWSVLLDTIDLGASNPWGITCSPDGKQIYVALSGSHEVQMIDRVAMHEKLLKYPRAIDKDYSYASRTNPVMDPSFLDKMCQRIKLKGHSPRGVVVIGDKVYAAEYFSDSIGMVTFIPHGNSETNSVPLGHSGPLEKMDAARRGEMYFMDATLSYQQWHSCSTCHPGGRAGSINWDLLHDRIGNPKSTKSLLLSDVTPPSMLMGTRSDARLTVAKKIRFVMFQIPDKEKGDAIHAYIKSMKPVPSPHLEKRKLSKSAKRGRKVFEKAGCGKCHSGKHYTDMKMYDVGTCHTDKYYTDRDTGYDTPTLIECWRTAPYLSDGRAATMKEVFTKFNKSDKHGKTSGLSEKEIDDLVKYVLSL